MCRIFLDRLDVTWSSQFNLQVHQKMARLGLYGLLLLCGCFQRTFPQFAGWTGDMEGSGKTFYHACIIVLFFQWCRGFQFSGICWLHRMLLSTPILFLVYLWLQFCSLTKLLECFTVGERNWTLQPDVIDEMYWSGSAPLCVGGCRAQHLEVRRDRCGDSSCCWLGYKSLCRGNTATTMTLARASLTKEKWSMPPVVSSALCFVWQSTVDGQMWTTTG